MERPKRRYQLENPSNSRIFINFKDKENPVSFDYPNKSPVHKMVVHTFMKPFLNSTLLFIGYIFISVAIIHNLIYIFIFTTLHTLLFVGLILIFSKNKKLTRKIPKINKWLNRNTLKQVIIDKLEEKYYEIPIFDNVFLEYIATEEFGEYLEKIEIIEHDFFYLKKSFLRKKFKKEQNDEYWKVKFIFSETPKKGELKVEFI